MSKLLVVIPTIFSHELRADLFQSLQAQSAVTSVLVVDNGNCFELAEHLELTKFSEIEAGCNLNWLAANNIGAAIALHDKFDYVCFLNDDVRLSVGFFDGLIAAAETCSEAGLISPLYTGWFCKAARDELPEDQWQRQAVETEVNYIDGTCMFMPVSTIRRVGFLDPSFKPPHWGADIDYSHRVREAGLKVCITHRAKLWHFEDGGGCSALKRYGSRKAWQAAGMRQSRCDLNKKYGYRWRRLLEYLPSKQA